MYHVKKLCNNTFDGRTRLSSGDYGMRELQEVSEFLFVALHSTSTEKKDPTVDYCLLEKEKRAILLFPYYVNDPATLSL